MNKLIGLSIISLASLFMLAQGFGKTGYFGGSSIGTYGYGRNGIWEFFVFIIILIIVASIFDFGGRSGKGGGNGHGYGGGKGSGKKGGNGYDNGYDGVDPWDDKW